MYTVTSLQYFVAMPLKVGSSVEKPGAFKGNQVNEGSAGANLAPSIILLFPLITRVFHFSNVVSAFTRETLSLSTEQ